MFKNHSPIHSIGLSIAIALCLNGCTRDFLDQSSPLDKWRNSYDRAYVQEEKKNYSKAESLYKDALSKLNRSTGFYKEKGRTLVALATCLFNQKKYDQAIMTVEEALPIYMKLWNPDKGGVDNRESALKLVELLILKSSIEQEKKQYKEALSTINSALLRSKKVLSPDHTIHQIMMLKASILEKSGQKTAAEALRMKASDIALPAHYQDNTSIDKMSPRELLQAAKESFEAMNTTDTEIYLAKYLPTLEKIRPDSVLVAESYLIKGQLLVLKEKMAESEKCFKRAIEILHKHKGAKNKDSLLDAYMMLASLELNTGNYEAAEELSKKAIRLTAVGQGLDSPQKTESALLIILTKARIKQNKLDDAEAAIQRRLEIENTIKRKDGKRYSDALEELARVYALKKDVKKARIAYENAITARKRETKINPVFLQELHEEYAVFLENNGLKSQAALHKQRAITLRNSIAGP